MTSKSTPWGATQTADEIAPGIIQYSTASHGGIWLSAERRAEMPDYMQGDTYCGSPSWYEEDSDWAMVAVVFPDHFPDSYKQAFDSLRNWKPEIFERFFGVKLETSDSYILKTRAQHGGKCPWEH